MDSFRLWLESSESECIIEWKDKLLELGACWETFDQKQGSALVEDLIGSGIPRLAALTVESVVLKAVREKRIPIGVFWDLDNFTIPDETSVRWIVSRIQSLLEPFVNPVQIRGYTTGMGHMTEAQRSQLLLNGCQIVDLPNEEHVDKMLTVDAMEFAYNNNDGAVVCLITDKTGYGYLMSVLKKRKEWKTAIVCHPLHRSALQVNCDFVLDWELDILAHPNIEQGGYDSLAALPHSMQSGNEDDDLAGPISLSGNVSTDVYSDSDVVLMSDFKEIEHDVTAASTKEKTEASTLSVHTDTLSEDLPIQNASNVEIVHGQSLCDSPDADRMSIDGSHSCSEQNAKEIVASNQEWDSLDKPNAEVVPPVLPLNTTGELESLTKCREREQREDVVVSSPTFNGSLTKPTADRREFATLESTISQYFPGMLDPFKTSRFQEEQEEMQATTAHTPAEATTLLQAVDTASEATTNDLFCRKKSNSFNEDDLNLLTSVNKRWYSQQVHQCAGYPANLRSLLTCQVRQIFPQKFVDISSAMTFVERAVQLKVLLEKQQALTHITVIEFAGVSSKLTLSQPPPPPGCLRLLPRLFARKGDKYRFVLFCKNKWLETMNRTMLVRCEMSSGEYACFLFQNENEALHAVTLCPELENGILMKWGCIELWLSKCGVGTANCNTPRLCSCCKDPIGCIPHAISDNYFCPSCFVMRPEWIATEQSYALECVIVLLETHCRKQQYYIPRKVLRKQLCERWPQECNSICLATVWINSAILSGSVVETKLPGIKGGHLVLFDHFDDMMTRVRKLGVNFSMKGCK